MITKIKKITRLLVYGVFLIFTSAPGVYASKINVPGDFPGSFAMDLLGGTLIIDHPTGVPIGTGSVNTLAKQILFTASAFDGAGVGAGTSNLTLQSISNWEIGTTPNIFGYDALFYINGSGNGALVDNSTSTAGHWSMNLPLYALWNGVDFYFSDFSLSTNATYNYYSVSEPGLQTISGQIMDYQTGDAFLVGQGVVTDPLNPFYGIRITLGIYGNDPVAVPVPAAVWLFFSGLMAIGGLGYRMRHKS